MSNCHFRKLYDMFGRKTFILSAAASDGWLVGAAPDASYHLTVTQTADGFRLRHTIPID
jgi:hypothetical protein